MRNIPSAILLLTLLSCVLVGCFWPQADAAAQGSRYFRVAADGTLSRPTGYREWIYVGTPTTPNDMNGGKAPFPEFHAVYVDPDSYRHFRKTGQWREGTILVKELIDVGSKKAVSGKGYFMGNFIGLEATIKSSKHYPKEPGHWAYYSFTNKQSPGGPLQDSAKPFATKDCNSCHENSADTDFVFTQYYPVLRQAHRSVPGHAR